ncbi:hypothetical protein II582_01970 [bacterium]|nr:hypothetical protein [bacterium]
MMVFIHDTLKIYGDVHGQTTQAILVITTKNDKNVNNVNFHFFDSVLLEMIEKYNVATAQHVEDDVEKLLAHDTSKISSVVHIQIIHFYDNVYLKIHGACSG